MKPLASRVKSLMPRITGSVRAFEEKHGLANGTLGALASGKRTRPSSELLGQVAAAFGVPVGYLTGEDGTVPPAGPGERTTERDDRYPTRREAMALLRGIVPDQVLEAVALQALKAENDPGLDHWLAEIKRLARVRADIAREVEVSPEETAPGRRTGR